MLQFIKQSWLFRRFLESFINSNKTGLQPVSRTCWTTPLGFYDCKRIWDEQSEPREKFLLSVLKGILPTHYVLFLFWSILGALLGVGWGGCQSGYKPCVPQVNRKFKKLTLIWRWCILSWKQFSFHLEKKILIKLPICKA